MFLCWLILYHSKCTVTSINCHPTKAKANETRFYCNIFFFNDVSSINEQSSDFWTPKETKRYREKSDGKKIQLRTYENRTSADVAQRRLIIIIYHHCHLQMITADICSRD